METGKLQARLNNMVRKDFKLDSFLQFQQNEEGQFPGVEGQDEFHQAVVTRLHSRYDEILNGGTTEENVKNKLYLAATRVAKNQDFIDEISSISIQESSEHVGALQLFIRYNSGQTFDREITQ